MTIFTLIDTNVLIDVWGPAGEMTGWSRRRLVECHGAGGLVVNTVVWSELAPLVRDEHALEAACAALGIVREAVPWSAAFAAGVAHARYRRAGGSRERTLPDFLVGAHAAMARYRLLTRDAARYRSYFPDMEIIAPDSGATRNIQP